MRQWPSSIRHDIHERLGPAPEIHELGGMGGAAVIRLSGNGRSAVLKRSRSLVETHVYTAMAGALRAAGVGMPEVYASCVEDDTFWLLIEHIPHPFPRQRWEADGEQLDMLRQLHEIDPRSIDLHPDGYQPAWPVAMTASALSLFDPDVAARLHDTLHEVREATLGLFEPVSLISGDPNPANWGLRDDGTLVLYDWERCALGAAAIDLGITVPGLGSPEAFQQVATVYSAAAPDVSSNLPASDIACAKVWAVVEFLAHYAQGDVVPTFAIEPLLEAVPAWLEDLLPVMGCFQP